MAVNAARDTAASRPPQNTRAVSAFRIERIDAADNFEVRVILQIGDLMDLKLVALEIPENGNLILGQTHFIKSVEDIYEAIVNTVPQMKFGIAFNEASGPCLTRVEGNDEELKSLAARNAGALAAGHIFVVAMRDGYPINVLGRIKDVPEVCSIYCATANPAQAVVAESEQGRGVLGVIDGFSPEGLETPADAEARRGFLRKIGYKR